MEKLSAEKLYLYPCNIRKTTDKRLRKQKMLLAVTSDWQKHPPPTNTCNHGYGAWAIGVAVGKFCWANHMPHRKNMMQHATFFQREMSPPSLLIPYCRGGQAVVRFCPSYLGGVRPAAFTFLLFPRKKISTSFVTWLRIDENTIHGRKTSHSGQSLSRGYREVIHLEITGPADSQLQSLITLTQNGASTDKRLYL